MNFYPRRRRNPPPIIIISLIDVLIVLIVFLLVTTSFRNQPSVRITLPDVGDLTRPGEVEGRPPVVVTIAKESPHFHVGTFSVSTERLEQELRDAAAQDPQVKLVVRADAEANWGLVAQVLFFARQAQIPQENVRAFTRSGAGGGAGGR